MADVFFWERQLGEAGDVHPVLGSLKRRITVEPEKSFLEHSLEECVSPVAHPAPAFQRLPDGGVRVQTADGPAVFACLGPLTSMVDPKDEPPIPDYPRQLLPDPPEEPSR